MRSVHASAPWRLAIPTTLILIALLSTAPTRTLAEPNQARKWRKEPVTYKAEDLSHITLYGADAVYRPNLCPGNITFTGRARSLSSLPSSRLGFPASDVHADGHKCHSAEGVIFDMFPIGSPKHFPPQWIFERSSLSGEPVNLTCGSRRFAIRYGYFNDVRSSSGFLQSDVVYLDFAVIPNTEPFAFCSYATRRPDGKRPIFYAPFPSEATWERVKAINEKRSVDDSSSSASPAPVPDTKTDGDGDGNGDGEDTDGLVDPDVGDDSPRPNGNGEEAPGAAPVPSPLFLFGGGSGRASGAIAVTTSKADQDGVTVLAKAGAVVSTK